jgi:hypothetical protein
METFMFKKIVAAAALGFVLPCAASAQFGLGVRAGTLGVGPEATLVVNPQIGLRGGIGITSYHYDGTFSDKQVTVDFPGSIWNVGVDLMPFSGGFHIGAGVMHRPQFDLSGTYTGSTQVGNNTYTGTVKLVGNMKNDSEIGPYGLIGFGRTNGRGLGFSLDLGTGYMGEGQINLTSSSCTLSSGQPCPNQSQFQADVAAEQKKMNDSIASYVKWHPIISLSLHYGFGQ